jgi:hypothetical protein
MTPVRVSSRRLLDPGLRRDTLAFFLFLLALDATTPLPRVSVERGEPGDRANGHVDRFWAGEGERCLRAPTAHQSEPAMLSRSASRRRPEGW